MNLKTMADHELLNLSAAKALAERSLTLEIIEILSEIRLRQLHLKRGYSSLHEYCVQELKYSDGAAHRRIKAMKLVEESPQVIYSIQSGALSLTTASQLQVAFEATVKQQKPLTQEMKNSLIQQVENKSRREAEKIIAEVSPEATLIEQPREIATRIIECSLSMSRPTLMGEPARLKI